MPRRPRPDIAKRDRDYLRAVIDATGMQPTPLAKRIGVAPSTLTRVLSSDAASTATLHSRTLAALEAESGIAPPPVTSGARQAAGMRQEVEPFTPDAHLKTAIAALAAPSRNFETWRVRMRALENVGIVPGDVIIVDLDRQPRPGQPCAAQVQDFASGRLQIVLRIFQPPYLIASSGDAGLGMPYLVDDDRVILKGLILPHRLRAD